MSMPSSILSIFEQFEQMTVLVIGDVMIDSYVWGDVNRISPEAPVPIVSVQRNEQRLGGAANVALNVQALGAKPILCSVIGQDANADQLRRLCAEEGIGDEGLVGSPARPTTVKHRILAGSQHILRVDAELDTPISEAESTRLLFRIETLLPQADVIIFEDYDKGVLTPENIQSLIAAAKAYDIPSVVDPKKRNFMAYSGCSLFKPNLKELREGVKLDFPSHDIEAVANATRQLKELMPIGAALITLSEQGVYITDFEEEQHLPAHKREISDVSGAGDTVVSIASLCLAANVPLKQVAGIANLGGGLVCEQLGVIPIDRDRLMAEAEKHYG